MFAFSSTFLLVTLVAIGELNVARWQANADDVHHEGDGHGEPNVEYIEETELTPLILKNQTSG